MQIPSFRLHRPKTLEEACRMAADLAPAFDFIGGGTDLLQNYKCRINVQPDVISLRHISSLSEISGLKWGAGVTVSDLADHPETSARFASVSRTCREIASPLIANTATVGGNLLQDTRCYHFNQTYWWRMAHGSCLKAEADICRVVPSPGNICYATYMGDLAPLLMCLDAVLLLSSADGDREAPIRDFFRMDGIRRFEKKKEEILTAILVPEASTKLLSGYRKLRVRDSVDYPEVGVAATLSLDGDRIQSLSVAATAVAPIPLLYDEITEKFQGRPWNAETREEIARLVTENASPYRNTYLVPKYRKKMAGVLCRRVMEDLESPSRVTI